MHLSTPVYERSHPFLHITTCTTCIVFTIFTCNPRNCFYFFCQWIYFESYIIKATLLLMLYSMYVNRSIVSSTRTFVFCSLRCRVVASFCSIHHQLVAALSQDEVWLNVLPDPSVGFLTAGCKCWTCNKHFSQASVYLSHRNPSFGDTFLSHW